MLVKPELSVSSKVLVTVWARFSKVMVSLDCTVDSVYPSRVSSSTVLLTSDSTTLRVECFPTPKRHHSSFPGVSRR